MMIRIKSIFVGIMAILISGPVLSETWSMNEGVSGEWSGEWTMDGTKRSFSCSQRSRDFVLTAKCTVIRDGNFVAVTKRQVSDGNDCNYFGQQEGSRISGTYFCKSGGPYNWTATVTQ